MIKLTSEEAQIVREFIEFREELSGKYNTYLMSMDMESEDNPKVAEKLKKIHESIVQLKRQALKSYSNGVDVITVDDDNYLCINRNKDVEYMKETVITTLTDFLSRFSKYVGRISQHDKHNRRMNYKGQITDAQEFVNKILIIIAFKA